MKPILYVKGSTETDVRLSKFLKFFEAVNVATSFIGWNRTHSQKSSNSQNINYIFSGGGKNNKYVMFYYPLWMIVVFFHFLFKKNVRDYNLIAVNFDTALPIFIVSKIRKIEFTYEIYDQFALSYNFPDFLKKWLILLDQRIMSKAQLIIHVDANRVHSHFEKSIVIENTPTDFYKGADRSYEEVSHKFAVSGLLNKLRGIDQIIRFAGDNPKVNFLFVGEILDKDLNNKVNSMDNIEKYDFMPQDDLFLLMQDCCGVFSLYNPSIEINKLAASNKVYDAMMLGIPVITNVEVVNSKIIMDNGIGEVINYNYDSSWAHLADPSFINSAISVGKVGRKLYLDDFEFSRIVTDRLMHRLN